MENVETWAYLIHRSGGINLRYAIVFGWVLPKLVSLVWNISLVLESWREHNWLLVTFFSSALSTLVALCCLMLRSRCGTQYIPFSIPSLFCVTIVSIGHVIPHMMANQKWGYIVQGRINLNKVLASKTLQPVCLSRKCTVLLYKVSNPNVPSHRDRGGERDKGIVL